MSSLEYVWAPIGSPPPMVRDNRHDSVHLFGAICPARRVGAAVIMPAVNTEAMNEHLAEISPQVAPWPHALLVCDGAGWHRRGARLIVPDNITLLSLPPYSPELNPMENVWDYLRGNKLSGLVWTDYEAIVEACRQLGYSSFTTQRAIAGQGRPSAEAKLLPRRKRRQKGRNCVAPTTIRHS
jgi:hypothetical protein